MRRKFVIPFNEHDEEWKPIPGYELFYEVSNYGRIRCSPTAPPRKGNRRGKILIAYATEEGYLTTHLCVNYQQASMLNHVAVALAFIGPRPEGHHVDHINHNTSDPRLCNLRYLLAAWNTSQPGQQNAMSKVTEHEVAAIRRLSKSGISQRQIAWAFQLSEANISLIVSGTTWTRSYKESA